MNKDFKKKVKDLRKDLEREISSLENELGNKKDLLATLSKVETGKSTRKTSTQRKARAGKKGPRRSKNRDMILDAASRLQGKFSLAELREKIQEKYPGFGGKYPSGTIITTIKSTPEIKKVKRGYYRYQG